MAFITLHGMDEAIANLNLHPGTLKSLLTALIRASFPTEESLREIVALPAEDIIRQLWNVDQPEEIRQKKKNLSSLKSAINKELKELTRQGKNPEGLIISRDYVFTISDEQKNDILQKLGIGSGLDPQDLISVVRALLDGVMQQGGSRQENAASLLQELDRAREKLAQVAGPGTPAPLSPAAPAPGVSSAGTGDAGLAATKNGQSGAQETGGGPGGQFVGKPAGDESFGDEEAEVIDQEQILADDAEIIAEAPVMEEIEVIDQEQILDQDMELVEETPPLEEAEAVEQQNLVDDLEIIDQPLAAAEEGSGSHDFPAADTEIAAEEDFAGAAVADARAGEAAFPAAGLDMAEADQNVETGGPLSVDEWLEEEETEVVEQEQVHDQHMDIAEEALPLADAEVVDQEQIFPDDLEIVDETLAGITEEGSGQQDFPAEDAEIIAEEEFAGAAVADAGAEEAAFPAAGLDMAEADQNVETGGPLAVDEWLEEEETEIIDQEQIFPDDLEIVDEILAGVTEEGSGQQDFPAEDAEIITEEEFAGAAVADAGAGEAAFPAAGLDMADADQNVEAGGQLPIDEWLEEEETEVVDQDMEIVEEALPLAEAEVVDQEQLLAEDTAMAGTGESHTPVDTLLDGRQESGRRLDLSHYIDADEAMAALPETLVETHDEYIAQILDRFMPKFIKIPAGYYLTGRDRPGHNERQAKKILLDNFYISQLPVTNDLFDFFVRETGYETDAERTGFGTVVTGRICNSIDPQTGRNILSISHGTRSQRMQGANWRHPQGPASSLENKANHPVVQVSRHDALAFAAWAGKRLPSEDEWEAAARGSFGFLFPWGNEWHGELANTEASLTGDTTPVTRHGKLSMSPFGVYDLLGNVFEWTATVAGPKRQTNGNAPLIYVLKGGCWTSGTGATAASRLLETETWSNIIGFRCAV